MPKSFNLKGLDLAAFKDPRVSVRAGLGALLLFNVIAALILFKPWGGSADDLERRLDSMRAQLPVQQAALARTKALVEKVQKARAEGDRFMSQYMLDERTAYSSVLGELDRDATQVGLKSRESQYNIEPIDGSDTLGMMTISANYEGPYTNLTKFINELDRSKQFLIIESLQASPQSVGQAVNVNFKLNTFVKAAEGELQ
jgi:hypothetical protein